jgi:hypothetical protein
MKKKGNNNDVSINARGKTIVASRAVLLRIPYFESLLSGRCEHGDEVSIDTDASVLKAYLAYAEDGFSRQSLLLTKLSSSTV